MGMLHLDVTVTVRGFAELGVFLDCEPDTQPSTVIPAKANEVRALSSIQCNSVACFPFCHFESVQ